MPDEAHPGIHAPVATTDRRKSQKTFEERRERTRERNRNAQSRLRQKQREEHDRLEQGIGVLQARIVDAKAVRQQRREQQDALLGRVLSLRNGSSTSAACQHLRPSDPAPSPQQNAPIASMQHPQGTPADTWQSHHTKHGALMRARPTSWDIYFQPDLLPPPIASFDGFASISYEDLLEASGAPSRIMSFSEMGCLDAVHAAQSVAAQRAGVGAARICWFVQSHYEVAPGVPLSFSTSLSSPECVASFVLHMVFAQTEVAVHGLRERQHAAGAFTMYSDEPQAASEIKRARHTARSQKHADALSDERGARGGNGAEEEAAIAELEGRLVAPASGAAGRSDCSTTCSDASSAGGPKSMRCGVNKVCNAQVAVRQVMHAVVATLLRCGVADTDTAWDLVRATGDQAAVVVAAFDGAARGGGGEAPAGADAAAGGDGSAVDSTGGQPRQAGACQASAPAAPEREPGSAGDGGGGTACGSAHRTAGLHRQASDGGGGREGDTRGQHSTPSMATPATSVASGAGDVAAGRAAGLADYHARVTLTLIAVLREVRDVCYAACDRWLAARAKEAEMKAAPARAAPARADETWEETLVFTLTMMCVGHTLVLQDAGRVMRSLAYNTVAPSMLQYEAENMHVHLYRDLRISPEQAFRLAAVWHRWLRDRRALGGIRTAALAILNTLPASVPTLDFTHISRLASGSVQHVHVCTYCAGAGAHAELAAHAGHACSHAEGRHGVCDGPVCSSCGAAVDGGEDDAPGLLGEDYRSTCRAAAAMRHLRHLLDAATKVSLSLMSTQWQPGGVMTAQQLTCMARRGLRSNGPPIDFMVLCQLAATQERRWELRRWPEVLTKPLPLRM